MWQLNRLRQNEGEFFGACLVATEEIHFGSISVAAACADITGSYVSGEVLLGCSTGRRAM